MAQEMVIMVGLPGSGKTTAVLKLTTSEPGKWYRVNYDELRRLDPNWKWTPQNEKRMQQDAVDLAKEAARHGLNIIVDNTNVSTRAREKWVRLAEELGITWRFEVLRPTLSSCMDNDAKRPANERVGRAVIERMALFGGNDPFGKPWLEFNHQQLVLVDMDGTLADCSHRRVHIHQPCPGCDGNKFTSYDGNGRTVCTVCSGSGNRKNDWDSFFATCIDDPAIKTVCSLVRKVCFFYTICIVSGRPLDKAGEQTIEWLKRNEITFDHIFMRNSGDHRPDDLVKEEILKHLPKERIAFVLDDRQRVVDMWRRNGLTCLQVAEGNF